MLACYAKCKNKGVFKNVATYVHVEAEMLSCHYKKNDSKKIEAFD